MLRERFRTIRAYAILLAVALSAACASGETVTNPDQPAGTPSSVNGSWSGPATDSSGSGTMTWALTQSGASVSGTLSMSDPGNGTTGTGTISGSVSGTTFQFALTVPPGGFSAAYATCSASLSGSGTVSASAISGTYTGTNSCTGPVGAGQITLAKQ